jgi:hypothetical protein
VATLSLEEELNSHLHNPVTCCIRGGAEKRIVLLQSIQLNPLLTCNPRSNLGPHQWINPNCFAAPTTVGQNGPTILPPIYGPAFFNWDMGLFKNFAITEHKTLQFRVSGYNWLNHPLWSFNGSNLNLSFDPNTLKENNSTFGIAQNKQGHRIIELSVKYFF